MEEVQEPKTKPDEGKRGCFRSRPFQTAEPSPPVLSADPPAEAGASRGARRFFWGGSFPPSSARSEAAPRGPGGERGQGHLPYPVPQFLPAPQNPAAPRGATASPFFPSLGSLASPCKQFFSWVKVIFFFFMGMLKAGWTKAAGKTCSGAGVEPQTSRAAPLPPPGPAARGEAGQRL